MAAKKNKKAKKPAVGKPAAGSNNKRDKNGSQPVKKADNQKNNQKNKDQIKKEAELRNRQKQEAAKKVAEKASKEKERQKAELQKKQKQEAAKKAAEKASREKERQEAKLRKKQKQEEKKKTQKPEKKKKSFSESYEDIKKKINVKKLAYAGAVLAAVIVLTVLVIVLVSGRNYTVPEKVKSAEFKGRMAPESVAFDIEISDNQQKALAKATKARGNESKFDFFINDEIVMNEYDDPALIEFGSLSSNKCVLMFYILDENGNELYHSLGVEPGKQIQSVTFFDEISYGTHEATVAVLGYDAKTYEKIGMQTSKIKLKIGVE